MSKRRDLTWEDTIHGFKEVTLHGDWDLMDRRVKALNKVALRVKVTDPETYLLFIGMMGQIADQIYFD